MRRRTAAEETAAGRPADEQRGIVVEEEEEKSEVPARVAMLVAMVGMTALFLARGYTKADQFEQSLKAVRFDDSFRQWRAPRYGEVEVKQWEVDAPLMELLPARQPVVLRGSVVDAWAARRKWSPAYLTAQVSQLFNVYVSDRRGFLYHNNDRPMAALDGFDTSSPFWLANMSTADFFRAAANVTPGNDYVYYSSTLEAMPEVEKLRSDLSPLQPLVVPGEEPQVNLWMGAPGVTAETHYDSFHNFFVQLHGRKRFTLMPPTNAPDVYLFPKLHPSYRQAQVKLTAPDTDAFPRMAALRPLRVTLEPGDMLYLPPFWFHRVECIDLSISINVWSDSDEYHVMQDVNKQSVPFEGDWAVPRRVVATRMYFNMLAEAVGVPHAMKHGHCTRYAPIASTLNAHRSGDVPALCAAADDASLVDKLREGVDKAAPAYLKLPDGVRETVLLNFAEQVVVWAVGIGDSADFWTSCFPTADCAKDV